MTGYRLTTDHQSKSDHYRGGKAAVFAWHGICKVIVEKEIGYERTKDV